MTGDIAVRRMAAAAVLLVAAIAAPLGMSDEGWFPEPFGPIYERPPGAPCPECECCSQRLCETAAGKDTICQHMSDDPRRVPGCPCTATAQDRARTRALEDRQHAGEIRQVAPVPGHT